MIKITYINGDLQKINVDREFFTLTLAPKKGKMTSMTPTEKATDLAFDLAVIRSSEVHRVEVFFPDNPDPRKKVFKQLIDTFSPRLVKDAKYKKTVKAWKKMFKNIPFKGSKKMAF